MEITAQRICGDTWCVIEPKAIVPYYRLNEKEIILLDSGCLLQGELEAWLAAQKLRVKAILTTHDHWDHVAAHQALQQVHGAKIYLPKIEAALHATDLGHLTAHANGNLKKIHNFFEPFSYRVDEEIGLEDGVLDVCGVPFSVVHTPGHSVDHVCYITPDQVLYVGDTLMSEELLRRTKLSYAASHEEDIASKKKLRQYDCKAYVLAHGSIEQDIGALIDQNIDYVCRRAEEVWRLITEPMSMEHILCKLWRHFALRDGMYYKNLEMGNMIRSLVQYLVSTGRLECRYYDGVDYYAHSREQEETTWN